MTKLEKLERAVASLPKQDYRQFRQWFLDRDWAEWDEQIRSDSESGKLDFLSQEAMDEKESR